MQALLSRTELLGFVDVRSSSITRAKGIARRDDVPDGDVIRSRIGGSDEVYRQIVPPQPLEPLVLCIGARLPGDECAAIVELLHAGGAMEFSAMPTP
jgi:hypothetical protein